MKLEDLHIGVSPLTDTVYIGTVSKRDRDAERLGVEIINCDPESRATMFKQGAIE